MAEIIPTEILDKEGPGAPPRSNGELIFEAPWESRLFGMTMSLHQDGLFEWEEFRQLLIDEIGTWDAGGHPEEEWSYYQHWAAAFERLLTKKGLCKPAELETRVDSFAARPHGHDH